MPKTKREVKLIGGKRSSRIVWDKTFTKLRIQGGKLIPTPQEIQLEDFRKDIEKSCFPVVIGFDLDAMYGIGEKDSTQEVMGKRLEKTKHVLECISSPRFACIARSQTPRPYVPPEMVDSLQEATLNLIETTYN